MDTRNLLAELRSRTGIRLPTYSEARKHLEQRNITTGTEGAPVPEDALAMVTVKLYDRLKDYSAAMAAGISVYETITGNPYPVAVSYTHLTLPTKA